MKRLTPLILSAFMLCLMVLAGCQVPEYGAQTIFNNSTVPATSPTMSFELGNTLDTSIISSLSCADAENILRVYKDGVKESDSASYVLTLGCFTIGNGGDTNSRLTVHFINNAFASGHRYSVIVCEDSNLGDYSNTCQLEFSGGNDAAQIATTFYVYNGGAVADIDPANLNVGVDRFMTTSSSAPSSGATYDCCWNGSSGTCDYMAAHAGYQLTVDSAYQSSYKFGNILSSVFDSNGSHNLPFGDKIWSGGVNPANRGSRTLLHVLESGDNSDHDFLLGADTPVDSTSFGNIPSTQKVWLIPMQPDNLVGTMGFSVLPDSSYAYVAGTRGADGRELDSAFGCDSVYGSYGTDLFLITSPPHFGGTGDVGALAGYFGGVLNPTAIEGNSPVISDHVIIRWDFNVDHGNASPDWDGAASAATDSNGDFSYTFTWGGNAGARTLIEVRADTDATTPCDLAGTGGYACASETNYAMDRVYVNFCGTLDTDYAEDTDPFEVCDDGANNGTGDGYCLSDCSGIQTCGDGVANGTEGCDDDGTAAGDGCSAACAVETGWSCSGAPSVCNTTCGDGILAGAEECDDNNTSDSDGCDSSCQLEATCGFTTSPNAYEDITSSGTNTGINGDDNAQPVSIGFTFSFYGATYTTIYASSNGLVTFGAASTAYANATIPSVSNPNALLAPFWDDLRVTTGSNAVYYQTLGSPGSRRFILQWDGVTFADNSGNLNFEVVLHEGTNAVEYRYAGISGSGSATVGHEYLDGSYGQLYYYNYANLASVIQNASLMTAPDACIGICGDGTINPLEVCDDGNTDNCTGACRGDCLMATGCGDSVVCGTEACDDGNTNNHDNCLTTCVAASCGDNYVWNQDSGTEACDDGNSNNNDNCLTTCVAASCGDGNIWNQGGGTEACDDGNSSNNDDCLITCVPASCGDGNVWNQGTGAESCDDSYTDDCGSCNANCTSSGSGYSCGDGNLCPEFETCDDNDTDNCTGDCNPTCTGPSNVCGDLDVDCSEACDDGDNDPVFADSFPDDNDQKNSHLAVLGNVLFAVGDSWSGSSEIRGYTIGSPFERSSKTIASAGYLRDIAATSDYLYVAVRDVGVEVFNLNSGNICYYGGGCTAATASSDCTYNSSDYCQLKRVGRYALQGSDGSESYSVGVDSGNLFVGDSIGLTVADAVQGHCANNSSISCTLSDVWSSCGLAGNPDYICILDRKGHGDSNGASISETNDFVVSGGKAYIANLRDGMVVFDVSGCTSSTCSPALLGNYDPSSAGVGQQIATDGTYTYMTRNYTTSEHGVFLKFENNAWVCTNSDYSQTATSCSPPTGSECGGTQTCRPKWVATMDRDDFFETTSTNWFYAPGLALSGNRGYVTVSEWETNNGGLYVVDLDMMVKSGLYVHNPNSGTNDAGMLDVVIQDTAAYVSNGTSTNYDSLILNISEDGECDTECDIEIDCGNGTTEGPEVCDDGANNGNPTYCNSTCSGMTP